MLADLQAERAKYGATMNDNQCVELCNAVAYKNRADGWGLNKKDGGTLGTRYDGTTCAHDVLHHQPTNNLYDCLIGAGAQSTPTFNLLGQNTNSSRPWVAPIVPQSGTGGGGGTPTPQPKPCKMPAYEALGGDNAGNKVGNVLFHDYERAGQAANPGMGTWFNRVMYDAVADAVLNNNINYQKAIDKHRAGWCSILGVPVDDFKG
jgi:hypothetical protein